MIIKLILLFLWIIACATEGKRDAHYYHTKMYSRMPDKQNIHWVFTLERGVILGLICWVNSMIFTTLNSIVFTFSLALIFSFLHNGMYFTARNKLEKNTYPKKWFSNSNTSTSRIELTVVPRTVMFVIGIIGIIASLQLK